ncbi:MAG: FAD-dependent oxidoreductase [Nanoarchaeota archaeon]|nr:FAD-dependent oxidoreductase [Nanoarchaeota archaeon]MBU0962503.1 FAD-dependent oxidoreductase [Nanoarchaeota archaeon]
MKNILILGGGLTGLTSAWKLAEADNNVTVIEKQDKLGGISSTFKHKNFNLDYGPHKIYTQIPEIMNEIKSLVKEENLLEIEKRSKIYLKGKYYDYPIGLKDILLKMNPLIGIKAGFSFGLRKAKNIVYKKEISYEDYLTNRFGKGIYELVFKPYAEKVWGNPKELDKELASIRVSVPSLSALLKNMLIKKKNPEISADKFYYPKYGIISLAEEMQENIEMNNGNILFNSYITEMKLNDNFIEEVKIKEKSKVKKMKPDFIISTIPIKELPKLLNAPQEIIDAADSLKYRPLILFYIVANKDGLFNDNWIFYPEKDIIFNRISEQKGFSKDMIPNDKTVLTVEITCDADSELFKLNNKELYEKVIADLEKVNILSRNDVSEYFSAKLKDVYPVYDLEFKKNLNIILTYLSNIQNLITNGRQGLFNYNNMDHCIDMGIKAARYVINNSNDWYEKIKEFNYKIVD